MKTYSVITAVEYGDKPETVKRYEAGDPIDLEDDTAAPLLDVGAISGPAEAPTKAKK